MYVCMYACMYVCTYVCMYVRRHPNLAKDLKSGKRTRCRFTAVTACTKPILSLENKSSSHKHTHTRRAPRYHTDCRNLLQQRKSIDINPIHYRVLARKPFRVKHHCVCELECYPYERGGPRIPVKFFPFVDSKDGMHVCICMHVWMYLCMYACMYV